MTALPPDFDLASYDYPLPAEAIAQTPRPDRGSSKLLVLDRAAGSTTLTGFERLADLLPPNALLVANNSRVIPARLMGRKPSGGRVECLLLSPLPLLSPAPLPDGRLGVEIDCLLRASKRPRPGESVLFDLGLAVLVLERGEFGRTRALLSWPADRTLPDLLAAQGRLPLPPYIARPDSRETAQDRERYQTVYASQAKSGSMAAPTAGLHFTPAILAGLKERGFSWAEVTLYVGYGTFSPVRSKDVREHRMHAEYVEISEETAAAVAAAKRDGRPVVAVGTTSARSLEGAFAAMGSIGPYAGWTDIFITPGYGFAVVDALLTNFHLPESSLLIMVSALAGRERILSAYREALAAGFLFFSYGDAMLIL